MSDDELLAQLESLRAGLQPRLDDLADVLGLSEFERDVLLFAAASEIDSAVEHVSVARALALIPGAHWSAFAPAGPLRFWKLIEFGPGEVFVSQSLRIDERILHDLMGAGCLDERLAPYIERPTPVQGEAPPELVSGLSKLLTRRFQVVSSPPGSPRAAALAACAELNLPALVLRAEELPANTIDLEVVARLLEREGLLTNCVLLASHWVRFLERLEMPVIVLGGEPAPGATRIEAPAPTAAEQYEEWRRALGPKTAGLNGSLGALVSQFRLPTEAIREIAEGLGEPSELWRACRARCQSPLDGLAHSIRPGAVWEDLVLPPEQMGTLRQIAARVRGRFTVYESWGFGRHARRGLGITVVFAGASGTGKTMAAEVLANDLQVDLYHIDLSAIVSKYIGETEKHLSRIFDAGEVSGAILLFDEADALFGKRSEVRDSHDRYANLEISYLLQRMESYRGLAILTTNMKAAMDAAFLRRLAFIVNFPFPDAELRAEIWKRIFPPPTPVEDLDMGRLARMNLSGGSIRNVALNAAFLAADQSESVCMRHVVEAARSEYQKLEKPLLELS